MAKKKAGRKKAVSSKRATGKGKKKTIKKKTAKTPEKKIPKKKVEESKVKRRVSSKKPPKTMEELLAATGYELKGIKRGQLIEGTITDMS